MMHLLIILVVFVSYPLFLGYRKAMFIDFIFSVKDLSSQYYTFGINFLEHSTEDPDYIEQEFTIALFVFSISIVFYKHIDDA